jgi:hypothetical protein
MTAMYEFTFKGEAGEVLCAAFEELDVTATCGTTVLRGELPDQAALHGVLDRINALGLELLGVRLLADGDDSGVTP